MHRYSKAIQILDEYVQNSNVERDGGGKWYFHLSTRHLLDIKLVNLQPNVPIFWYSNVQLYDYFVLPDKGGIQSRLTP